MATLPLVSRSTRASSSRLTLSTPFRPRSVRSLSIVPNRSPSSNAFFGAQFGLRSRHDAYPTAQGGKGKGKEPGRGVDPEAEVDDREWDIRVARAMLHLQETLPLFFSPEMDSATMFPPEIFSQHVMLKLPPPLPIKISSLSGYGMAFSVARSGMHAFHTDLRSDLERMTFSPSPADAAKESQTNALLLSRKPVPAHRKKQIRVLVSVYGTPRLPSHTEAKWHTSSLYTFSPTSGLISSHEVETIRPLPGEGVSEWLMSRLLGWTSRNAGHEGAIPCPRTAALPPSSDMARFRRRFSPRDE
ncbi:hypothetical protein CI109_101041 [Kwoniella shandongensis]|uniref:Uncharacterized protein n=1 Tax=Kwoniella shandongensis TaxID=1734106 RepID=A0A5M6C4Q2_9TREE|nr:uncharacterized protein CI109_001510 [Kwoniella shandongensis]KAA5530106.1 hypothetical protein CI109_001510 [Kwoniella shandongensis]